MRTGVDLPTSFLFASSEGGGDRLDRSEVRGITRIQLVVSLACTAALLILLLPLVVINHSRGVAERERDEKLAEMAGAGYAVTLEEIGRRYVYPPDEANAALLYERAHLRLDIPDPIREELPWNADGWPDLGESLPAEWDPRFRELLERNEEAITLYREAARRPDARYPIEFTQGWNLLIPHVSRLRESARFFSILAVWQAGTGDWDEAADSLETLFAAGRSLRDEPILISQLTRMAIAGIGCDALERILAAGAPPPAFLVRMQRLLETEANDDFMMRRALTGEMAFGIYGFAEAQRDPEYFHELFGDTNLLSGVRAWIYTFSDALIRDELFYLEMMQEYLRAAEEPLPDRLERVERIDDAVETRIDERSAPTRVSAQIMPTISRIMTADALGVARARATLHLIALERFRGDHGRLPENLVELDPNYLDPLPDDPVSGERFGYRIEDDWAIVTSEGEMRDGPLELRLPAER